MKLIYIAAPWKDRELMPTIGDQFERASFVITHKWWLTEDIPEAERSTSLLAEQAQKDYEGVRDANLLILLNTAKSEGKAVEQGIAIALQKKVIAIGKRGDGTSSNVFHYLPNYYWYGTIEEYLDTTATMKVKSPKPYTISEDKLFG